jgi:hypothetical protein
MLSITKERRRNCLLKHVTEGNTERDGETKKKK